MLTIYRWQKEKKKIKKIKKMSFAMIVVCVSEAIVIINYHGTIRGKSRVEYLEYIPPESTYFK